MHISRESNIAYNNFTETTYPQLLFSIYNLEPKALAGTEMLWETEVRVA